MDLIVAKPSAFSLLLVEDDDDDAFLVGEMLTDALGGEVDLRHVDRVSDARDFLHQTGTECVLLDLSLPDARRLEALVQLRSVAPDVPIVILSGLDDELLAVTAVQEGAQDYLIKGRVDAHLLGRSINYAIERKRTELELTHQAMHDSLTGLPNRALFLDRLSQALSHAKRDETRLAVLFMDLNRFKLINDSLGHAVGDQLLVAVATRLRKILRESDTAARFGGDEFMILCEKVENGRGAVEVVKRILNCIEAPFILERDKLFVSASVGIAVSGVGPDDSPGALIRDADAAMYRAKERGTYYELFDEDMRIQVSERSKAEDALRQAVERNEFRVLYQPLVDLRSGDITGLEALVRWQQPERGLVLPGDFLPLAEETSLMIPIGAWVLKEACRQGQLWRVDRPDLPLPKFAVNLSASELSHPGLIKTIRSALAETGTNSATLCFEITETVVMDEDDATYDTLMTLKELGVSLSVDDFGTGYASLGTLKRFPIDVLKIDRLFVAEMGESREDTAIVASLIKLAHDLGMTVVAEGVETEQQLAALRAVDCDVAQGFYFAPPQPAETVGELLSRSNDW